MPRSSTPVQIVPDGAAVDVFVLPDGTYRQGVTFGDPLNADEAARVKNGRIIVDGSEVVQPISASALPLPTGAASAARQDVGNTSLAQINAKLPALSNGKVPVEISDNIIVNVSSSVEIKNDEGNAVPVTVMNQTVPTGAATEAKQDTGNQSLAAIAGKLPELSNGRSPVSLASIPLASNAATATNQASEIALLNSINEKLPESGQATEAKQNTQITEAQTANSKLNSIDLNIDSIDQKLKTDPVTGDVQTSVSNMIPAVETGLAKNTTLLDTKEAVDLTNTRLETLLTYTDQIENRLQTIADNTDTLEVKAENINLNTDTLEAKLQQIVENTDTLELKAENVNLNTDQLESKIDTLNGKFSNDADGGINVHVLNQIDSGSSSPAQFVSALNNTTTPLGANEAFNGDWEDITNVDFLEIGVLTDQHSALNGAILHFSLDGGVTEARPIPQTIIGGVGALSFVIPVTAFNAFRIEYWNGPVDQTYFQVRIVAQAGANPLPVVPIGSIIKATDGAVLVNNAHNSYISKAITVTDIGDNSMIIPDTGKRLRLYYIALSADASNIEAVNVIAKFAAGGQPIYKLSLVAGAMFARNVGAGRHYVEGQVGEALMINLNKTVNGVHVSLEYEQY